MFSSSRYTRILVLAFLLLGLSGVKSDDCPQKCVCNKGLTSVNCEGKGLDSIPPNIPVTVEKLFLDHNRIGIIDSFSLSKLLQLKILFLRNNQITRIEPYAFAGTTNIDKLYLTGNHLVDIDSSSFRNCSSLTFLHLAANSLKKIPPLGSLLGLQSLILEGNKLIDVTFPPEFTNLHRLYDITLSNNNVTHISGRSFEYLKESNVRTLMLSRSNIAKIGNDTFSSLKNLQSLKIAHNPLSASQLENAVTSLHGIHLISINIANVKLDGRLPSSTFSLFRNSSLTNLIMPNNNIGSVPDKAFAEMPRLIQLDISASKIRTISPTAFEGLTQLNLLFLYDNHLTEIPQNLPPRLLRLYLNGNQINEIIDNAFSNLYYLRSLFLASNNILTLKESSFVGLQSLHELHLSVNHISVLPGKVFQSLINLQSLDLSRNNINRIPETNGLFSSQVSLTSLNLNDNGCYFLPFNVLRPLKSLENLHLENNRLQGTIAADGGIFSQLSKLRRLFLVNNDIPFLPSHLLEDLMSLEYVDASSNRITHWGKDIFKNTHKLQTLRLDENIISLINKTSLQDLKSLQTLNLTGNPFSCSCDLRWFRDWVNTTKVKLPGVDNYTCNSPPEWAGKRFLTFDKTKIDCANRTLEYILISAGITLVVSMVMFLCVYRKRWFIRLRCYRLCNRPRKIMRRDGYEVLPGGDQLFDAYVACAGEDSAWVFDHLLPDIDSGSLGERQFGGQFRLCFEERENTPGRSIVNYMADSISRSKKALVILSKSFCDSARHHEFELMCIIEEKSRRVLQEYIIIQLGDLKEKDVPKVLHGMMERGEFIEWGEEGDAREHFKRRIIDRLSHDNVVV